MAPERFATVSDRNDCSPSLCFFSRSPRADYNDILRMRFSELTDTSFEGIALGNGASRAPGGQSSYLCYCRLTETSPYLSPSGMSFSGNESGSVLVCACRSNNMDLWSSTRI